MTDLESKHACVDLLREAEAVYVTTVDEGGRPQTRAMFNLLRREQFPSLAEVFEDHGDHLLVYLSTNTTSGKVRQMEHNPEIAAYYCDPATFRGVQPSGRVEFVSDPALKRRPWQPGWEMYFPRGIDDPDYTVVRLRPESASGWLRDHSFSLRLGAPA